MAGVRQILSTWMKAGAIVAALLVPAHMAAAQDKAPSALGEIQTRGTVRVGWAPWYPYAFKDPQTNKISGLTVDLIQDMAQWLKVDVQWVEDSWGTMIAGLQANKFDMLMPMAVTLPRAQAATFSDSFMKVNLGVMVRKEDAEKYKTWADLDQPDTTIAVALGSNTALYAKRVFQKAKVMEAKGEPEAVTSTLTRKSQAWASTYDAFKTSAPGREQLHLVAGPPFAFSPVALVVRQGDFIFRDWVDHFLMEEKTSGALLRIVQKYGLDEGAVMN